MDENFYLECIENLLREQTTKQRSLSNAIHYLRDTEYIDNSMKSILDTVNSSLENNCGEESTLKILQVLSIVKRKMKEKEVILSHYKILQDYSLKDFETIQTLLKKHSFTKYRKTINFGIKTCEDCDNAVDLQFRSTNICHAFQDLKPVEKCMCNSRLPLRKCSECFFPIISRNICEENDSVQDLNEITCLTQCLQCGRKICIFGVVCVFPEVNGEWASGVLQRNIEEKCMRPQQEKRKVSNQQASSSSPSATKKIKIEKEPRRCRRCKQTGHLVSTCGESNQKVRNGNPPFSIMEEINDDDDPQPQTTSEDNNESESGSPLEEEETKKDNNLNVPREEEPEEIDDEQLKDIIEFLNE